MRKIGIYGLHPAAGATHLTLLAASYFSHYERCLTEVYSCDGKNDLSAWQLYITGKEENGVFRTKRCVYHKEAEEAFAKQSTQAEVILYDFGHSEDSIPKLLACDEKWIIGSSGLFYENRWRQFTESEVIKNYFANHGSDSFCFFRNHDETGKWVKLPMHLERARAAYGIGLGTEASILAPSKPLIRVFRELYKG